MAGLRLFYFVLFGQAFVLLGSSLVNFGLGVWAYETAGRVSDFTYIAIAASLPGILLGPVVGTFIDRWPRKLMLLISQLVCAAVSLILAILFWQGSLELWHILAVVPLSSIGGMALQVGFTSTISMVVPKESLPRANGVLGLTFGSIQLAGPLMAGIAIDRIGLEGVFAINLASFVIGLLTLAVASLPSPPRENPDEVFKMSHIWRDMVEAYRYLRDMPGVLGGLYLFALILFNVSIVQVLFLPLILTIGTKTDLGFVQSMCGVGTLVGGILMVVWKGARRKMLVILGAAGSMSAAMIVIPMTTAIPLLALGGFCVMMLAPVVATSSQTLWQQKINPAFQGRVFSFRNTVIRTNQPVAFLAAGWLADRWFEPWMQEGAWLAQVFGEWWGVGEGRGVALLISLVGLISVLLVLATLCVRRVRRVDLDIPDFEAPEEIPQKNKEIPAT